MAFISPAVQEFLAFYKFVLYSPSIDSAWVVASAEKRQEKKQMQTQIGNTSVSNSKVGANRRLPIRENLIPTNGVHITEAKYPQGFYVAQYDDEGFTSNNRWFPTKEQAETFAKALRNG